MIIAALKGHLEVFGNNTRWVCGIALQQGHLDVVQLLLEARADMSTAAASGTGELFVAADRGRLAVMHC